MKRLILLATSIIFLCSAYSQSILWENSYNGGTDDSAIDIATDANDNVYVLGQIWNGSDYDQILVKYNSAGTQQWFRTFNNTFSNKRDIPVGLGVDGSGNIYTVANTGNEAQNTAELRKYNSSGTLQWNVNFGGAVGNDIIKILVDASGNSYVAGSNFLEARAYLAKYNTSGVFQWSQTVDESSNAETFYDIYLDDANNFIYAGGKSGDLLLTAKYNTNGTKLWVDREQLNTQDYTEAYVEQVVVDGNGFVYAMGTSISSLLQKRNYLLKYNSSGAILASNEYNFHDDLNEAISDLNRIYVATNDRIMRVQTDLTMQWSDNPGGSGYIGDLVATSDNNVIYGYSVNNVQYRVYDLNGNILDQGSGNGDNVVGVALKSDNSPAFVGYDADLYTVQFCEPPSIVVGNYAICEGGSTVINASVSTGASISWSPTTGLSDPTSANPTVSAVGVYTITATYPNGCSTSEIVLVSQNPLPPRNLVVNSSGVSSDSEIGFDPLSDITLQGSAGSYTYSWLDLDDPTFNELTFSNGTIVVNGAGRYYAEITNNSTGCENTTYVATLKKNQAIAFDPIPARQLFEAPFDLTATASSGLSISYTSSNPSVASISGSTITIHAVGSTTITAQQPGNSEFIAATNVQQSFTVNKADQTITFGMLNDIKLTDPSIDPTGTASSGLEITYLSDNTSVAVVNNGQIHPVGVGTTTITASQSGNGDYNAAPDVDQTLTVLKGDQTIDFAAITGSYNVNNNSIALSADASSLLTVEFSSSDESVLTISGSHAIIEGGGTATITASQPGNSLYNAAPDVSQEVTINKLSQTVDVPDLSSNSYTFGQSATPFQVSNSSGTDEMTFESSDENVVIVQNVNNTGGGFYFITLGIVGAGTATFTATQPGDDTYEAASAFSELTVSKANQSISFSSLSPVFFGDSDFELSASAGSGLPVTFSSSDPTVATVLGTTVTIVGGGVTTITAAQAGNNNFNPSTNVTQDLTVLKLTQTINFNTDLPANNVFGDGPFSFAATASSGLPVTFSVDDESVITVTGGAATIQGAGNATITATQAGNQNYQPQISNFNVFVDLADQFITFDFLDAKKFGDPSFDLTATSTSGLPISYSSGNESVATVSGNTVTIIGVGSTLITASQDGNSNFYAAGSVNRTLTVDKADQTITFGALNDMSPGEMISLSASSSSGLSVSFEVSGPASLLGNDLTATGEGTVTVTASQAGNANYNTATNVERSLEVIDKISQTITFSDIPTKTFGDESFDLNATATSGLIVSYVSSDLTVATISGSTVTIVGAGSTTITASQSGDADYHPAADEQKVLTVNKADQVLTFDLGSNTNKTFGEETFAHGASTSSGLEISMESSNPSVVMVDDNNIEIVGAGTATITASQLGNDNYNAATPIDQVITVAKAEQGIIFDPSSIEDQLLSDATTTFDAYSELGDPLTVSVKSGPATVVDIGPDFYEVTFTGAGEVVIEASVDETDNYLAATSELSFSIIDDSKQSQTITFSELTGKTFGDASFTISASSSSGLDVSFVSSDPTVATIDGTNVTIVGAGTTSITASQTGDDDYFAAADVNQDLVVDKLDQVITLAEIDDKNVTDEPFEIVAESNSDLPISLSTTGPVEIDGTTVTLDGTAGTVTITASQASDENHNSAEATISFSVTEDEEVLGLLDESSISIYPNPTQDYLWVQTENQSLLKIYGLNGNLLMIVQSNLLDLRQLNSGVYLLVVQSGSDIYQTRIIKAN